MIHWLLAAAAVAAAPTAEAPAPDDWKKVAAGDVVIRAAPELSPPGAYGWVEIAASPETIWDVLLDPAVAQASSNSVTSCEKYLDEPGADGGRRIGLRYKLNVALSEVNYHVLRDFRPDASWMTWTLDPDQQSDLTMSAGYYVLSRGRTPGKQLLAYRSQVDAGRRIPRWIQQLLTGRTLKSYLNHVRDEAERR